MIVTVLEFLIGIAELGLCSELCKWELVAEGLRPEWLCRGARCPALPRTAPHCPALPRLGGGRWRWPTTLDSSSYVFGFLGTTALTFLPTHFCFLKACVQELFCCFHFTLPIKASLKAGWAVSLLPQLLCSLIWQSRFSPLYQVATECCVGGRGGGAGAG